MCNKLGLKTARISKQTRHLPYNHPSMSLVRDWVKMAVATRGIHEKLICHFDQVWTTHYEPSKKCLYKDANKLGELVSDNHKKPSQQRMLDEIKSSLCLPVAPRQGKTERGPKQAKLCAQSTLVPVDYQRLARTTTTLSWSDGSMGQAWVTAPASVVSSAERVRF